MEYKIVHGDDEDQLTERVNATMQDGWVPIGGVAVLINTFSKTSKLEGATEAWEPWSDEWHQAMVKAEQPEPPRFIPTVESELGW